MAQILVPYEEIGITAGSQAPPKLAYDGAICSYTGHNDELEEVYYEDGRAEIPDSDDVEYESVTVTPEPAVLDPEQLTAFGKGGAETTVLISDEDTAPPDEE